MNFFPKQQLIIFQQAGVQYHKLNPQFKEEGNLYRATDYETLYQSLIDAKRDLGILTWKHSFFFFAGLRNIQQKKYNSTANYRHSPNSPLKLLEDQAFKIMIESFKDFKILRCISVNRIIDIAILAKFDQPDYWKHLRDYLLYNTNFENARDITETLEQILESDEHFGKDVWRSIMDNIVLVLCKQFTCTEFIQIVTLYKQGRKSYLCKDLIQRCKHYIVEDIDNLGVKDLLLMIEVYKHDKQFKRFIGNELKVKIIKNQNLSLKEVMTSLLECLDLEDLRKEIIKYSLNSEIFYAFPISYLISLLNRIYKLEYHPDFYDLLKTIQIQLCLLEKQMNQHTIDKLIRIHLVLPIVNVHFMTLLLHQYNLQKSYYKKLDYPIFNANISLLNLPQQNHQQLIEEYEIALTNIINIDKPEQFNIGYLVKFLCENPMFAKHGFFKGFNDLLFTAIMSDDRSCSDVWMLSVITKIVSLECSDQELFFKIEKMIEKNFERYCYNALIKIVVLVLQVCPNNTRYKELLLRRVRLMRPDQIAELKLLTQFLQCVAILDTERHDQYYRFFQHTMKFSYQFAFLDIVRVIESISIVQQQDSHTFIGQYEKLFERIRTLGVSYQIYDLIMNLQSLTSVFPFLPTKLKDQQLQIFGQLFQRVLDHLKDQNKRVIMLFNKYHKIFPRILDNFSLIPKNDQLLELKPIIQECIDIIDEVIKIDRESRESTSDSDDEEEKYQNDRRNKRLRHEQ